MIVLATGFKLSGASLLRLEGDTLVATTRGDTVRLSVNDISEITQRSRMMGLPGCWFGTGAGALIGAACAAAIDPIEVSPSGNEMKRGPQVACGAILGGGIGAVGGCILFPENERRYVLKGMTPDRRRSTITSILCQHSSRME